MTRLQVEVDVAEGLAVPLSAGAVEEAVLRVLRAEGVPEAEVSVALVRDAEIARLNADYLGHEGPTDVISFPLHRPGQPPLGDVYVCVEQARRQANELDVPLAEEVLRLVVHGTLHVLGYEHPEGEDREGSPMYRRQEELLEALLSTDPESD